MFGYAQNKNPRKRQTRQSRDLVNYESLEPRNLLATVHFFTAGPQAGTLLILGDAAPDTVTVSLEGSFVQATVNGVNHSGYPVTGVQKIQFNAGPGNANDFFENRTSIPSLAYGGGGDDTLIGGAGRDEFYGGDGNDDLRGNGGFDKIHGGNGNDLIRGGAGDDYLVGNNGNDMIWGGDQNDRLLGGAGDDLLFGEDGEDWLYGFEGKDYLNGGNDRDRIYSGGGRFNDSILDVNDYWNDSELIRGGSGQVSRLKGNFSRMTDGKVYVLAGNLGSYPITVTNDTLVRLYAVPITASLLTRNHFLEVEFDYVAKTAISIRATMIYLHEGNDQTNSNRAGALAFSPGALHNGGVAGRASSAQDVDWFFFRSNIAGPVRLRVINPTLSGWAGANIQVQTANGFVLDETNYFISNFIDLELNKGQLYWIKATGYSFQPLDYQLLFEPLEG